MIDQAASSVGLLAEPDQDRALDTILLAFASDPGARWYSPSASRYVTTMTAFARAVTRASVARRSAYATADGTGVALWLPPGTTLDPGTASELQEALPDAVRADLPEIERRIAEQRPSAPHWYLAVMGVDPAYQGRGIGHALLTHACDRCDAAGGLAYLESSNPRNLTLYRRHGFEALETIEVGSSPPFVPMLRQPR